MKKELSLFGIIWKLGLKYDYTYANTESNCGTLSESYPYDVYLLTARHSSYELFRHHKVVSHFSSKLERARCAAPHNLIAYDYEYDLRTFAIWLATRLLLPAHFVGDLEIRIEDGHRQSNKHQIWKRELRCDAVLRRKPLNSSARIPCTLFKLQGVTPAISITIANLAIGSYRI